MNRQFRYGAVAVGAALLFVPALFLSPYRLGLLALVASYTLASLAQNLLAGYADVPSLGNVAFFATSAYVTGGLIEQAHVAAAAAIPAGIVAAGALGFVVGLPAIRISGMHLAIVTIALVFVVQELMQQWDTAHNANGVSAVGPGWLLDDRGLYIAAIVAAEVGYLGVWNLLRSRSGRAILAGSENTYAARSIGIDTVQYKLIAFVVSGAVTGLAGAVYLYYAQRVTPGAFTLDLSLAFLTMMIVGGTRSLAGSALGAVIIGLLPEFLTLFPSRIGEIDVQQSVYGLYALLLLATLRYFPSGLWNAVVRLASEKR